MKHFSPHKFRFTPENRLLLFTALDCKTNPHIDDAIFQSFKTVSDWGYLTRLLIHHGTLSTFLRHLARLRLTNSLPDALSEDLAKTALVLRYRNSRFMEEIKKIAAAFDERQINLVFVKGAMLILSGYYDVESRFMEDLDCVVHPKDAKKARALLLDMGYREPDADQLRTLQFRGEMQFIHALDREIKVELSLNLNKNYELAQCYPFRDEELQTKITRKDANGIRFHEIEKEYHFAYCLFHHVSVNYLHRLNWLNDLYLMASDPRMEWEQVGAYLDEYGLRKSWHLPQNIFFKHFQIQLNPPVKKIPDTLKNMFLNDDCRFANLEVIEAGNVSIRFLFIDTTWHKIIVVMKKVALPVDWLRRYYNLDRDASPVKVYLIHYVNSLKRFLKIRTRHGK